MNSPKKSDKQTTGKTGVSNKSRPYKQRKSVKSKALYNQKIFRDWCKACGICSAFCPKKVIGRNNAGHPVVERPDDCIGCRFCELHCPDFAITIRERDAKEGKNNR